MVRIEEPRVQQTEPHDGVVQANARRITLGVLSRLFGGAPRTVRLQLWDGTTWPANASRDAGTVITLHHPGALRAMFLPPTDLALGEAYIRGIFDISGDLEVAFRLNDYVASAPRSPRALLAIARLLRALPEPPRPTSERQGMAQLRGTRHSRQRDQEAVRYHYDVSNDFYALWLDQRMVYSCAYFPMGTESLDAAQEAKLDLICRKLRLKEGERLLDIGCGWGGLVRFAAERYGVRATGVTLSVQQAALARERIAAAGLADRVQILLDDYRNVLAANPYDKIVSVGMFEHVGRAWLPEYFRTAHRLLKPGGLFLNHGIAAQHDFRATPRRAVDHALSGATSFVERYVFPDGDLVPVSVALGAAERAGWEVRDVESLREHYATTLRHWGTRLAAHEAEATRLVGAETYRVWRLYMAGSAYNFARERVSVFQSLLAKPDTDGHVIIPPTRADLYRDQSLSGSGEH